MVVETKAFFIFSKFATTLRTCEEVDDTMDGKDNKEEKTRPGRSLTFACITSVGIISTLI